MHVLFSKNFIIASRSRLELLAIALTLKKRIVVRSLFLVPSKTAVVAAAALALSLKMAACETDIVRIARKSRDACLICTFRTAKVSVTALPGTSCKYWKAAALV